MIEYMIIVVLLIICPVLSQIAFKKGIRKGSEDFFKLLVAFGFESKVKAFKVLNESVLPGGIVFVGDSITQDYPVSEWFQGHLVYNRGIGGDTTEGLLKRMDVSIFDLKPKTVIFLMGTNDFVLLNKTAEQVAETIESIIKLIKSNHPDIHIIIQSIYPVNPLIDSFTVGKRSNRIIQETNALLKMIKDITFLDVYPLLSDASGHLKTEYSHDGLHVNMHGYKIITQAIKEILKIR